MPTTDKMDARIGGEMPPVFVAASSGAKKCFDWLVEHGCDITVRGVLNCNLAMYAALHG
jgi:hypothetical protein